MPSDKKATLDAIMRALEIEKETFDFYVKSEQKTFDPSGKRIFRWLAKSEEVHYLKLTELYNALSQGERWVFYAGSTIELEPEGDATRQVTFDTSDLAALEIAMDIEKKGMVYFADLIEKTDDPAGKDMLTTLYNEEKEHLRVITEKYNELK